MPVPDARQLAVHALDKASNKEQSIRIEGSGGLSKEEIERMVQDAEAHAAEDATRRDIIEKHNQLDSMIYQAEKTLAENAEKLSDSDQQNVKSALEDARKELESDDPAKLDAARQRVERELHQVAEALYKAQTADAEAGAGAAGGAEAPPADDADVVDAEYTEEKGEG